MHWKLIVDLKSCFCTSNCRPIDPAIRHSINIIIFYMKLHRIKIDCNQVYYVYKIIVFEFQIIFCYVSYLLDGIVFRVCVFILLIWFVCHFCLFTGSFRSAQHHRIDCSAAVSIQFEFVPIHSRCSWTRHSQRLIDLQWISRCSHNISNSRMWRIRCPKISVSNHFTLSQTNQMEQIIWTTNSLI